jgi:hypothetical protein
VKLTPRELMAFAELWRALHIRPAAAALLARRVATDKRGRARTAEARGQDGPRKAARTFKAERAAAARSRK